MTEPDASTYPGEPRRQGKHTTAAFVPANAPAAWLALRPFSAVLDGADQVLLIAGTKGAKSTLAASLTLHTPSLVAIDEKARLTLPGAEVVELPAYDHDDDAGGMAFRSALQTALRWRPDDEGNRVILRPYVLDIEDFDVHDDIYQAVYLRGHTLVWIDEITATGATAQRSQPWLRAVSARGRTRGLGMITLTQAPFGLTPAILRRNATYIMFGPIDSQDLEGIKREGIEVAALLPRGSGLFIVYTAGDPEPSRLYLPIPAALTHWEAP